MKLHRLIEQLQQVLAAEGDIDCFALAPPRACPDCLSLAIKLRYDEPDVEVANHPEAIRQTRVRVVLIR